MSKTLTLDELNKQIQELQKQANLIIEDEKTDVITELKAKIKLYKLTAEELGFSLKAPKAPKTGATAPPAEQKYKNAEGKTWSGGRGPRPSWVQDIFDKLKIELKNEKLTNEELKEYFDKNGYLIKEVAEPALVEPVAEVQAVEAVEAVKAGKK